MKMDDTIKTTLGQIKEVMGADSIVGNPIYTKNRTVIPISKVALGFGLGQLNNSGNNDTELAGVGGGGSIDPIAFLVIYDDVPGPEGVELIPLDPNNPFEGLLSGVADVAFDLLNNKSFKKKSSKTVSENIDKIKTKIKTEDNTQ